ncbi:flagellar biosynthesis protein FlhF [Paraburkholderia aspalathi]|uniref:hypothetical protein n=1 Tax=Paraburkholderia aspalathi TaxID=1324617 RepID=UPI00190D63A0|nr:hypothetical protein [Paraburkholderia aspalathi]MBK3844218.1 hypothetical protein [Paraburkholderia aspalathi]
MLALAHEEVPKVCDTYALVMHDWSRLNFHRHTSKTDKVQMTHATDVGYELQSSLLVSDRDGQPITAPAQNLVSADGVLQTRHAKVQSEQAHLDELSERIAWLEQQEFGKPLLHIVDREADSVAHLRHWSERGCQWLVRVKAGSLVSVDGKSVKPSDLAPSLNYTQTRAVLYHGQSAIQEVGQAQVVLTRKGPSPRKSRLTASGWCLCPVPPCRYGWSSAGCI